MSVSWEALSALATAASALVIAITVLVGARQVSAARHQVDQLRRATQLEGTMAIFNELNSERFLASLRFVSSELPERMRDEAFARGQRTLEAFDESVHPEIRVLRTFEKIGVYVKYGLLDPDILYDFFRLVVTRSWNTIEGLGIIEMQRAGAGKDLWENFELLCRGALAFNAADLERQPRAYEVVGGPPSKREE